MCEDLWKSCALFGGDLEGCNEEKNGEATERIVSIVKCEETLFEGGACENPVGLFTCDKPIKTAEYI